VLRAGALAAAGPLLAGCGVVDNLLAVDVVRVAVSWGDAELAAFQSVLNGFRADHPYEVDVIPLGDDIADAVTAQVNGRPDVVMLPTAGLVKESKDRLAPLPDGVWRGDWLAAGWRNYVWLPDAQGRQVPYGLPFKVANQSVLWYRKDLFDALGLRPPEKWSQWLDVNDALRAHGVVPLALGAGDGWPLTGFFGNVLQGAYPDLYQELATPRPSSDLWVTDEFAQALRLLGGMVSGEGVLAGGVEGALASQYPDSVVEVFGYHNAAMVVSADFALPVIEEFRRPPATVGVVPFPVVDGIGADRAGAADHDLQVGVASFSPDHPLMIGADVAVLLRPPGQPVKKGAADLVAYLADPRTPLPWISGLGGFIAANKRTDITRYDRVVQPLVMEVARRPLVFNLSDELGSLGGSGALYQVLEDFLRTVGDGHPERVDDAAAAAGRRMRDIEVANGR
jgi:alpha-glucoside transport system substrate-binding protein